MEWLLLTTLPVAERKAAVEWLLLTTLPVAERKAAVEVLDLYALRWRIEDWHRILKSGCDVEKTAHSTAERIKRAVALNAVIAWRLSALTLLGRATPELPAENLFAKSEIAMLLDYAHHMGFSLPCQANPGKCPNWTPSPSGRRCCWWPGSADT